MKYQQVMKEDLKVSQLRQRLFRHIVRRCMKVNDETDPNPSEMNCLNS